MIYKEIKEICLKCEHNIHCQGKGCAFRSLGNEYCDEVENVNNLINDLQQRLDKAIHLIKEHNKNAGKLYYKYNNKYLLSEIKEDLLVILER